MNTIEVLEIIETELAQAQRAYNSVVLMERLRGKSANINEEERLAGLEIAVEIFKAMSILGKQDCLKCLNEKRKSIKPSRKYFLDGFDFVLQLSKVWEP